MNPLLRSALAVAGLAFAAQAAAQVTFYEREGFAGQSFTTDRQVGDFGRFGFNDRASSVDVAGSQWEVCDGPQFTGRCVLLRPGRYPSLATIGLNDRISSMRNAARDAAAPPPAAAQITFYERDDFRGRSFTTDRPVGNFERFGFNDRASSVDVAGHPWEVCDEVRFTGRCVVLRPGRYPSLAAIGLSDRISSARVDENRYAPTGAVGSSDYHRRNNERLYEATITSVRAVVGTPEQRCWIEREQLPQERSGANVPGAIVGGVIGGIIGHQFGHGRGQDIATVGGAAAGAAVGSNVGRTGGQAQFQDVQRCANVPTQSRPDFWDVIYTFRGQEHRVQLSAPPQGPTITVNERGEPRA